MEKHGVEKRLKGCLASTNNEWFKEVLTYMKGLSPSGVELEIMTLANFDFTSKDDPNSLIGRFLEAIELTIQMK